jgi:hypothetical protein
VNKHLIAGCGGKDVGLALAAIAIGTVHKLGQASEACNCSLRNLSGKSPWRLSGSGVTF